MYIFKNAFISIKRNIGRNVLIGIIILVVSIAVAVTLAIRNSATTLIEAYEEKYDVTATISMDRSSLMKEFDPDDSSSSIDDMVENFSNIESITVSDIVNYGDSEYVSSYYYTESVGLNSNDIEAATTSFGKKDDEENSDNSFDENEDFSSFGGSNMKVGGGEISAESSTDFTITGYSSYEAMEEFISGSYTITDGEVSSDFTGNYCVINSELATLNGISVGDTITFVSPNDESITYTLEVTGIFEETTDSSDSSMQMFSNSANTIITNVTVIENIVELDSELQNTVTPSFVLTSKDVIDAFTQEVQDKGLSEYLTVSTNLDEVESATESISNVKTFATTFLIITFIIGAVVLFVISMINIKERRYEIGVLRTIGMKKSTLTMQFVIELGAVALVALLLGCLIGAFVSVPTANMLLESEITSSQESQEDVMSNFGKGAGMNQDAKVNFSGVSNVEQISSIDAVVDFTVLLELLGIGLLLTFVSSIASMISIQRFSPLTILKERS